MQRSIDVAREADRLNHWVRLSIRLFEETSYLDDLDAIYPFRPGRSERIDPALRRDIIIAHQGKDIKALLDILMRRAKFPYEDPMWHMLKKVRGCAERNPRQLERVAAVLFSMTAEEAMARLEAPPKLNTQVGPMFRAWLRKTFDALPPDQLRNASEGIKILEGSEPEGRNFVTQVLGQDLPKCPDLVAKAGRHWVIGEAKWIGQPGGNQGKQVKEVIQFCQSQRGDVRRVGVVDGFPWALYSASGRVIATEEAVLIQECPYDILSALLLSDYLQQFL